MSRVLLGVALCALAATALAQGKGMPGTVESERRSLRDDRDALRPPSNPGIAPPLDIRIQGEGISLPPGVAEDEPASKPAETRAAPEIKPKPDAKPPR